MWAVIVPKKKLSVGVCPDITQAPKQKKSVIRIVATTPPIIFMAFFMAFLFAGPAWRAAWFDYFVHACQVFRPVFLLVFNFALMFILNDFEPCVQWFGVDILFKKKGAK